MGVFRRPYKVRTLRLRNVNASCWHGDVRTMHDVGNPDYQPQLRPRICKDTSIEGSGFGGGHGRGMAGCAWGLRIEVVSALGRFHGEGVLIPGHCRCPVRAHALAENTIGYAPYGIITGLVACSRHVSCHVRARLVKDEAMHKTTLKLPPRSELINGE